MDDNKISDRLNFKSFEYPISLVDRSNKWSQTWNSIKTVLDLLSINLKFKDSLSYVLKLSDLNIKFTTPIENNQNSVFFQSSVNLYFLNIPTSSELKQGSQIENINKEIKEFRADYTFVNLIDLDPSESAVKKKEKETEKIRSLLELKELYLIPSNLNVESLDKNASWAALTRKFLDCIRERISNEITDRYNNLVKEVNTAYTVKFNSKENNYKCIKSKNSLAQILHLMENHEMLFSLYKEEILAGYLHLKNPCVEPQDDLTAAPFNEPFSFVEFDHKHCLDRISDQSITILEYQQYILCNLLICIRQQRNYDAMIQYISKFFTRVDFLRTSFKSKLHFAMWVILLCDKVSLYLRFLNSNSEADVRIQNDCSIVLNMTVQRMLLVLSRLLNIDYLDLDFFTNVDEDDDNEEIDIMSINSDFLADVVNRIDCNKTDFLSSKTLFYKYYLEILDRLVCLFRDNNQVNSLLRYRLMKLPYLFYLKDYQSISTILSTDVKHLKPWVYLHDCYSYVLLLITHFMPKTESNLNLVIDFISERRNFTSSLKRTQLFSKNLLNDIISDYLRSKDFVLENTVRINMENMLRVEISFDSVQDSGTSIYTRGGKSNAVLKFRLVNSSSVRFSFSNVRFHCFDRVFNKDYLFDFTKEGWISLEDDDEFSHFIELAEMPICSIIDVLTVELVINSKLLGVIENIECKETLRLANDCVRIDTNIVDSFSERISSGFLFNVLYFIELTIDYTEANILEKPSVRFKLASKNSIVHLIDHVDFSDYTQKEQLLVEFPSCREFTDGKEITIDKLTRSSKSDTVKIPFVVENIDYMKTYEKDLDLLIELYDDSNELFYLVTRKIHKLKLSHLFSISSNQRRTTNSNLESIKIQANSLLLDNTTLLLYRQQTEDCISKDLKPCYEISNLMNDFNYVRIYSAGNPINRFLFSHRGKRRFFYFPIRLFFRRLNESIVNFTVISPTKRGILQSDGFLALNEIQLKVDIKKLVDEESIIMIKVRESSNWAIVGKSIIVNKLSIGNPIKEYITVIPLVDGHIRIPKIEIFDYKSNPTEEEFKSLSNLEFLPVDSKSIITGNETTLKIYPLRGSELKVGLSL